MTPLRQRTSEDMRIRNLAAATQNTYVDCVAKYARYFGQSPDLLGSTASAWQSTSAWDTF